MDSVEYIDIDGKEFIPVIYTPADDYALLALVSMVSLLKNTNKNIDIVVLYSKLNEQSFEMFNFVKSFPNCRLTFAQIDENIFKDFQGASWVTIQAWFKAIIPNILSNANKALYLDCDTMVRGDIYELYSINIDNVLAGTVTDVWNIKANCERLKMKSNSYFNSGVILINCKKWRETNLFEKVKNYASNNKDLRCGDQDGLNFVIDEDKKDISKRYNFLETWFHNYYHQYEGDDATDYEESKKNPLVIHFTAWKPTHPKSRHSFRYEWWNYAKQTPYYVKMLEKYKSDAELYVDDLEKKSEQLKNLTQKIKELNECINK